MREIHKKIIKNLMPAVFSVVMIFSIGITVFADTIVEDSEGEMDKAVASIIRSQLSESEASLLGNTNIYDLSMQNKTISNKPVLKIYDCLFWGTAGESLEKMLYTEEAEYQSKTKSTGYVVLDAVPYEILRFTDNAKSNRIGIHDDYVSSIPVYISDILNLSEAISVEKEKCKLEGIYCFNAEASHLEIAVYLKTDKGVKVYM